MLHQDIWGHENLARLEAMPVTISRLWTQPYQLALKSALSWGKDHRLDALDHVLVGVELSNGAQGVAEAPPRPTIYGETPQSIAAIIAQDLTAIAIGQPVDSVADIQALQPKLTLVKNNHTARGALDMALYGALAQSHNTTLADLLHVAQARVRVSYILGTGTLDQVMDEVQTVYDAGVRVLKVKVGKNFERETVQIRQMQATYGSALDLYVDANQCYDLAAAQDYLPRLAELGVLWCEEPLPVTHLRARQTLRQQALMPLIADDSAFTLPELERELAFDTFDVLNIKTARNGFSEAQAMLGLAQAAGKGLMVGSQASSLLGCLHALMFAAQAGVDYPTEATFYLKTVETDPSALPITDGFIDVRQAQTALNALTTSLLTRR
jgi:L-Ala-D/L-Glu epimerase